jgi:hypothetical protein
LLLAHSPRQEGANPVPGSRHKKLFEGVAASAGWRGRRTQRSKRPSAPLGASREAALTRRRVHS